ncbi:MAG: hypothetical protein CMM18_00295 [Rhodospirillaceae bacterium]|nr:hypothetical protein [Rhodospirillaceae bacterium]
MLDKKLKNLLIKIHLTLIFLLISLKTVYADVQRIAVVVNDEIISEYDINERIKLITFSSKINKDKKLREKVLNLLIDEKIKIQELDKLGLIVTDEEISKGIIIIENQNKMKKGELRKKLNEKRISAEGLYDQIKGELAWQKIISRKIIPQVVVSESELEEALKIETNSVKLKSSQLNLSQIIFDKNKSINEKQFFNELNNINTCNDFEALGKNLNAKSSINLGYINIQDTPEKIRNELINIKIGDKTNLISTNNGNQVFMICDIKNIDTKKQRNKIREQIARKKIFNLSKKYLDEIKRESIIDIRK